MSKRSALKETTALPADAGVAPAPVAVEFTPEEAKVAVALWDMAARTAGNPANGLQLAQVGAIAQNAAALTAKVQAAFTPKG